MIYENELVHYKRTIFPHPPGLQIFKSPRKTNILERILRQSIDGVQYLWQPGTRRVVRIFWLIIVVTAIVTCFTMYSKLTQRHNDQILTTVVETSQLPIYSIGFPSVALCPWNHVNWLRYKAAEEKFLPPNVHDDVREIFHELLMVMDRMTFTQMDHMELLVKRKSLPSAIRNIVLFELAQFMAFRCDELFVTCVFDGTPHECCKIFVPERTERGICLVFNSMISEESRIKKLTDKNYPWKIRTAGEGTGLTFTLRQNSTHYRPESRVPFGFSLLIKEAEEWSDSLYHYMLPNTRNYISIIPVITEASASTRGMDPRNRRCLFSDEKTRKYDRIPGLPFNKLNCRVRCQQDYVMRHCNCTLSMFFPTISYYSNKECKVSDMMCLYQNRDIFNYMKFPRQDEYMKDLRRGMICDCIDNCQSLIFLVSPNTNLLKNPNITMPEVQADIYISKNVITKYGAHLDYTSMDLVANFGGVLGLCLGASVLSLFEIIYGTIRVFIVWIITKWKKRRAQRRVETIRQLNKKRKYKF